MSMEAQPALKQGQIRGNLRAIWATTRLLYQVNPRCFLLSAATGVMQALFYPLLLLIAWKGFSLIMAGGGQGIALFPQGVILVVALFGVLALQHVLRIVNETATSILKAESSQQANERIIGKMSEIPYWLFEENDFQARYGLVISQATFRLGMLVEMLISTVSALVSFLAVTAALLALAPLLVVLLMALIPLSAVETRFHRQSIELQTSSAPDLFRMQYLAQKSIDATWQRDIRVHNSRLLDVEYRTVGHRYLSNLRRLLRRFQWIRSLVGIAVAAMITMATGAVFWLISQSPAGLAEAAILLPALYIGVSQGKAFAFAWGTLVECLGYIEQVFDFFNQSFACGEAPLVPAAPTGAAVACRPAVAGAANGLETRDALDVPAKRCPEVMALEVDAVTYRYPHSDKLALSEMSYTFARGTTAIVGPNGAGKSTLVKLLTGLLMPTAGSISVLLADGTRLSPQEAQRAVLFQEPSHLYLTIRQNITMRFDPQAGEDAGIYDALVAAGLGHVVRGLPDGLDTLVGAGFGGMTDLSGGQWQRLALARLIYQDAPVIILDEPVASLDPTGERAVFELFAEMAQSKIIIFTTHRYDSIPRETKISVLVDGVITESGTHDALFQRQRDYWSLYMAQAAHSAHALEHVSPPRHTRQSFVVQARAHD